MQVCLRKPKLLRAEHIAESRLSPALETLQLVHRSHGLCSVPSDHACHQLAGT